MERGKSQNIVGAVCRRLRKEHGWKQHEFIVHCQLLGWALSRETLAKIESGVRRVNDAEVALLARALGTTADAMLNATTEELLSAARHSPDIIDEGCMAADDAG